MQIKKIVAGLLIGALLVPTNIVGATENMPNTSLSDTDKTSPCEVTADIHYAYYISMPATLTLEPADYVKDAEKWAYITDRTVSEWLSDYMDYWDGDYVYNCWYQIKAKAINGGLGGKYIKVAPKTDRDSWRAYELPLIGVAWESQEEVDEWVSDKSCAFAWYMGAGSTSWVPFHLKNETSNEFYEGQIMHKSIFFGDIASEGVIKIDSNKWSTVNEVAYIYANDLPSGKYKGNFEFIYGLVDTTEDIID